MRLSDSDSSGGTGGVIVPALQAGVNTLAAGQANGKAITDALALGGVVQISTPGTYYLARPTTNYDAAIQCDNLTGAVLQITSRKVILKLADGANCYMEHWWRCTDCASLGGTWDGNVAANTGTSLAWWAAWHGDLTWIDGCLRVQKMTSRMQADPTYQGSNAVLHGIWVTGDSRAKANSSYITVADNDMNMQRDSIHTCGGMDHCSFRSNKGFHGDNFYGIGTADYPTHQVAIGSVTDCEFVDTHTAGGLQAVGSFFGRNENEQVAGFAPTRIKMERVSFKGGRGSVQNIKAVSVVKGNPTIINTATPYLWRNGINVTIDGALGTGWSAINGVRAITQVSPTQFTIPVDTSALVSANYTANSANMSSCASGIQIADDSAGGGGNTYTGFTITSLSLSGDSLTATVTPNIMSSGSGGTYAPIIPGTIMVVDSAGTNETVQVQYVVYTGIVTAPTQFVCIKTDASVFSAAAGTYAGKTLTGTSPGALTALYVDSMEWDDIKFKVGLVQPVASISGTGVQNLAIGNLHAGSKNAGFAGISVTGTVQNLAVGTIMADIGFGGVGLQYGNSSAVNKTSVGVIVLDGTGASPVNTAICIAAAGTIGMLTYGDLTLTAGAQVISTNSSLVSTKFNGNNITWSGNGYMLAHAGGAGGQLEFVCGNFYAGAGTSGNFSLTGSNTLGVIFRLGPGHNVTNSSSRSSSQTIRMVGGNCNAAFLDASAVAGDYCYNDTSGSFEGVGWLEYTTGWTYRDGKTYSIGDGLTIGARGNLTAVWTSGTAAQTENLPPGFDGQVITFMNGHATVPTTLSGSGHNIVSAGASAATKVVAALTSLTVQYDATNTIWRSIA